MDEMQRVANIMSMIEDGELLSEKDIEIKFKLSWEEIKNATRYGDLDAVVHFAGRDYFYTDQVEMYIKALSEDEEQENEM